MSSPRYQDNTESIEDDSHAQPDPLTCKRCGACAVVMATGEGRTTQFRMMQSLRIPADLKLLTCIQCQTAFLAENASAAVRSRLLDAYMFSLRNRVRLTIDTLMHFMSQRRIEEMAGISQGYLSRLRRGKGHPSPELVGYLALLAFDPPNRLAELRHFWQNPDNECLLPIDPSSGSKYNQPEPEESKYIDAKDHEPPEGAK